MPATNGQELGVLPACIIGGSATLPNCVRSHHDFRQVSNYEKSVPFVHFVDEGSFSPEITEPPPGTLDVPTIANGLPNPAGFDSGIENGGDAGGCIVPITARDTVRDSESII